MGIGFVIFLHLIGIFLLSIAIAVVACIVAFFFSVKEKRKHTILIAIISPFIGLYSFYFVWLFGSITVSEIKNIDLGIGDTWYVPLGDKCQLQFVDLPEQAFISNDGHTVISDVSHLQQVGNQIFGKTYNQEYFAYDIKANELKQYTDESEFENHNKPAKTGLTTAIDFYKGKKNDIAGYSVPMLGVISIAVSLTVVYLIAKVILGYLNFR